MIWLAWRRQRLALLIALGVVLALGGWMTYVVHLSEAAAHQKVLINGRYQVGVAEYGGGLFSPDHQASIINLLLLALPCLLGILLGSPLVAGELSDHTNRLAWTQGVTRTRWLVTKVGVAFLAVVVMTAGLVLLTSWWSEHTVANLYFQFGGIFGTSGSGRIVPFTFGITGLAPIAYVVFALALGIALGAVFRRVPWAVIGVVVVYGVLALVMATTVRPSLAPQSFVPFTLSSGSITYLPASSSALTSADWELEAWDVGTGYRYAPGSHQPPGSLSAGTIGANCELEHGGLDFTECLTSHEVQLGEFYQRGDHYWDLQWKESSIYLVLAVLLFGAALVSVRRWRA